MPATTALLALRVDDTAPTTSETSAIRAVVERDYAYVWRFLRHLGVAECQVDDAAQTVIARVLAREATVRAGVERAYLMKAALHVSFEYRRGKERAASRTSEVDVESVTYDAPAPDEALARRRQRALLDAALDQLPSDLRAAFTLFELEALSFTEVAEVLDIPRGTVASRIRRARELFTAAVHRLAKRGSG
ncbi:MAG TPA: sigma-70 family RNA polymerase sigma factor [Polyangiaceae bacterium]